MLPDTGERYLSSAIIRKYRSRDDGWGTGPVSFDAIRPIPVL